MIFIGTNSAYVTPRIGNVVVTHQELEKDMLEFNKEIY